MHPNPKKEATMNVSAMSEAERKCIQLVSAMQERMTEVEALCSSIPKPFDPRIARQLEWAHARLVEDAIYLAPLNFSRPGYGPEPFRAEEEPFARKLDELAEVIAQYRALRPTLPEAFCAWTLICAASRAIYILAQITPAEIEMLPPHADPAVRQREDDETYRTWFDDLSAADVDLHDALHDVLEAYPELDDESVWSFGPSVLAPRAMA
jgi:hypothetical protein